MGVTLCCLFVFCLLAVKNNLGTLPSVNFINCILVLTLVCCFLCFRVFLLLFFFAPVFFRFPGHMVCHTYSTLLL